VMPAGERHTAACAGFRWQPPAARAGLCADLRRRRLAGVFTERKNLARRLLSVAEGSYAPPELAVPYREKEPRAPPAGGRRGISCVARTGGRLTERKTSRAARGQVELAHAYATCAVMSGLDKGP
jgi:hypothetical protein